MAFAGKDCCVGQARPLRGRRCFAVAREDSLSVALGWEHNPAGGSAGMVRRKYRIAVSCYCLLAKGRIVTASP